MCTEGCVSTCHLPLVGTVCSLVAILHEHVGRGIQRTPAHHTPQHLAVGAEVGDGAVADVPLQGGRFVPLAGQQRLLVVVVTVFEQVVIIVEQFGTAVFYHVESILLGLCQIRLVALRLVPARACQIDLCQHRLGTPACGAAVSKGFVGQVFRCIRQVVDDEPKHILLRVAGTNGIVDHLLVVLKQHQGSPHVHGIEQRHATHQAGFTDGCRLGFLGDIGG